jgi:hypothetical protein
MCLCIFIALKLCGGKFQLDSKTNMVEKEAWEKFLIPNVKSERLIYFNSITREVFQSAYVAKQSRFQPYLDGQRRFRYGVKTKSDGLQKTISSYKEGVIPKQNINWHRYKDFPSDVKVDDVSKSHRAVEHFKETLQSLNALHDQLLARKKELYNENMEERVWASDELKFIKESMSHIEEMVGETEKNMHDVQYVVHQLETRFNPADVQKSEKRRRVRREKENRSKLKRKKRLVRRKHEDMLTSGSSDEDIDIIE